MAGSAVVSQSPPNPSSPSLSDRHSKDIPAPLSLDARPPSSPFPSPSSSFVPPPMPGAHEFANKPPQGRFVRRKKSGSLPDVAHDDVHDGDDGDRERLPNGNMTLNTAVRPASAALTPLTPTPASLAKTPTTAATSHSSPSPPPPPPAAAAAAPPEPNGGRDTPTQIQITLPPPPSSPTQIFAPPSLMRTPSGSGSLSRHTSLSSSRPAPASPAPSRRQSGAPSLRSRHRSGLSVASLSSSSKFGTLKSSPPLVLPPAKRRGEIKVRDFAYPAVDARHTGRGPDTPKVIKRLLKLHGPLTAATSSRRASGISESSVDSEDGNSRRSSGFGGWGAFRWASKLGGAWGFSTGSTAHSRPGTSGAAFVPNQFDLDRNFSDGLEPDSADSPAAEEAGEYFSEGYDDDDDDEDDDGEGESEELLPGLYRALYDFDPEGTAEMGLKEGQTVRVVGRGGGVGWAIAVRPDAQAKDDEGGESNWALVPESYLKVLRLDEAASDADDGQSPDDAREAAG